MPDPAPAFDRLAVGFVRLPRGSGIEVPVGKHVLFGDGLRRRRWAWADGNRSTYGAGRSVARAKYAKKCRVNPATGFNRGMEWFDWHRTTTARDVEAHRLADAEASQRRAD